MSTSLTNDVDLLKLWTRYGKLCKENLEQNVRVASAVSQIMQKSIVKRCEGSLHQNVRVGPDVSELN